MPPFGATDIKFICRELDVVLTGRMHLGIAALGQGTAVMGVEYQGKFEGLFRLLDLPDCVIQSDAAVDSTVLMGQLKALIDRRKELSDRIRRHLPQVVEMSKRNFLGLGNTSARSTAAYGNSGTSDRLKG